MSYYSGFVAAVSAANKQAYAAHARKAWPYFEKRGALRMVEGWGSHVSHGETTDFFRATQAKNDEMPVFSWIEWPDRSTADAGWADIMADEAMGREMTDAPFDGARMFWGGFAPVVEEGDSREGAYLQCFVLAVPGENKQAFIDMARDSWPMFRDMGALRIVECWGEDVPHGKLTDFYRATDARDGEVAVFSWLEWPDEATCQAAARQMQQDMDPSSMPAMPFDGKRMMWGGFEPLVDTRRG